MLTFKIQYHLYRIREERNLSARQLAKLSGVSHTEINNIESGIKHPTVYTLCLLSLALDVSPHRLFSMEKNV